MKFEKRIKKALVNDADMFMRARKQEILCKDFLDSVSSQQPMNTKRKLVPVKRVFVAAMVAVLLICSAIFVPLSLRDGGFPITDQGSTDDGGFPITDQGSTDSGSRPNLPVINDPVFEPSQWVGEADTPYAIINIGEISSDTIRLSQNGVLQNYVKVEGEVIASYNTEKFDINNSSLSGADVTESKVVAFNNIREFYITEQSIELIEGLDAIFVNVVKMNMDGKFYYGPVTNDQGIAEFLPVVEGKLQINENDYNTRSFLPIQILNDTLDELMDYRDRGGEETEFTKALPSKKIINGVSTDEVDLYFKAWNCAKKINATNRRTSEIPT